MIQKQQRTEILSFIPDLPHPVIVKFLDLTFVISTDSIVGIQIVRTFSFVVSAGVANFASPMSCLLSGFPYSGCFMAFSILISCTGSVHAPKLSQSFSVDIVCSPSRATSLKLFKKIRSEMTYD